MTDDYYDMVGFLKDQKDSASSKDITTFGEIRLCQ